MCPCLDMPPIMRPWRLLPQAPRTSRRKSTQRTAQRWFWCPRASLMGSKEGQGKDGERPQRQVTLDSYYIYKYEVTVAEYRKFCEKTHRAMPPEPSWKWQDTHPSSTSRGTMPALMRPGRVRHYPPKRNLRRRRGAPMAEPSSGAIVLRSQPAIRAMARRPRWAHIPLVSAPTGRWIWRATCGSGANDWYDPDYYVDRAHR